MLESDIDLSIIDESIMFVADFLYDKYTEAETFDKRYNNSKFLYFWKLFFKLDNDIAHYLYDNEQQ